MSELGAGRVLAEVDQADQVVFDEWPDQPGLFDGLGRLGPERRCLDRLRLWRGYGGTADAIGRLEREGHGWKRSPGAASQKARRAPVVLTQKNDARPVRGSGVRRGIA